jgi:hypothetical protein
MFVQLGAYQHHAFLDWRLVEGGEWEMVNGVLNGAGVPSMQAKWEEMFQGKEEAVEEKVKKPVRNRTKRKSGEKKETTGKKTTGQKSIKKTK